MSQEPQRETTPEPGEQHGDDQIDKTLAEMRELAEAVAAARTSPKSGVELVDEQRR